MDLNEIEQNDLNFKSQLIEWSQKNKKDLELSRIQNDEFYLYDQAYESKAPDYFRVDFGVSYRKNKPNYSWMLSLNIQNLTNRENIWDQYYDTEKGNLDDVTMVGLIPILNYRVEF